MLVCDAFGRFIRVIGVARWWLARLEPPFDRSFTKAERSNDPVGHCVHLAIAIIIRLGSERRFSKHSNQKKLKEPTLPGLCCKSAGEQHAERNEDWNRSPPPFDQTKFLVAGG